MKVNRQGNPTGIGRLGGGKERELRSLQLPSDAELSSVACQMISFTSGLSDVQVLLLAPRRTSKPNQAMLRQWIDGREQAQQQRATTGIVLIFDGSPSRPISAGVSVRTRDRSRRFDGHLRGPPPSARTCKTKACNGRRADIAAPHPVSRSPSRTGDRRYQ